MFGVLIRSSGTPVGRDSTQPTETFIRRSFTTTSTVRVAATTVEISTADLLFWVTIMRSNQLNYAPRSETSIPYLLLLIPFCARAFQKIPQKCRDRALARRSNKPAVPSPTNIQPSASAEIRLKFPETLVTETPWLLYDLQQLKLGDAQKAKRHSQIAHGHERKPKDGSGLRDIKSREPRGEPRITGVH